MYGAKDGLKTQRKNENGVKLNNKWLYSNMDVTYTPVTLDKNSV